jgi:hypothetical protein
MRDRRRPKLAAAEWRLTLFRSDFPGHLPRAQRGMK